jgi:hypothetical protein
MTTTLIDELRAKLPVSVEESTFEEYVLMLSGLDWRLRVSGPWRLINAGVIETSSGAELRQDMTGRIGVLRGLSIQNIDTQSRFAALDLALTLSNGMVLEIFSENIYDDWLLTFGDMVVEGPLHQS